MQRLLQAGETGFPACRQAGNLRQYFHLIQQKSLRNAEASSSREDRIPCLPAGREPAKILSVHSREKPPQCGGFFKSGRQDSNLRPPGPKPGALPACATSRTIKLNFAALREVFTKTSYH